MTKPNALILRAPGTNCDVETAFAFERAGAAAERLHINRLLESPRLFEKFQILCIPGGFSYGDDLGAGRILGLQVQVRLGEHLDRFKESGKLILGICNGFQVLMKTHVLVSADENDVPEATLTSNDSGRYEDRWMRLAAVASPCVFLRGLTDLELPVAHAEGKFVARNSDVLTQMARQGRLALRYRPRPCSGEAPNAASSSAAGAAAGATSATAAGSRAGDDLSREPVVPYPDNPNGAEANVAGICDATGRVLGLMPHPERCITRTQHPRWTRGEGREPGDGLALFRNAVEFFA